MFKKECCRHVEFKGIKTKWPIHKQTHKTTQKYVEYQDATDNRKKTIVCVFMLMFKFVETLSRSLFCIKNTATR